jgi:hypothetical protein
VLPYRSEYFPRFESKLVSREGMMTHLKEVYLTARQYLPNKVQSRVSGASLALDKVVDKIPNIREEEGPPHIGEELIRRCER